MALLVTAYYPLLESFHNTGNKDWESRLEHFLRIARLHVKVLVFTDEAHGNLIRARLDETYNNRVEVNTTTFPDFKTMTTAHLILGMLGMPAMPGVAGREYSSFFLPPCRNAEKDTIEYMTLQMCKTEFVAAALHLERYRSIKLLVWFDFSLGRLLSVDGLQSRLEARLSTCTPGKIIIPGCCDASLVVEEDLFRSVCWRFCGGFFCGDREAIALFFEAMRRTVPRFLEASHGIVAWEVNVWAWLEKHDSPHLFEWYPGDHNDAIL